MPYQEEFDKEAAVNLRDLIAVEDGELDIENGRFDLEQLRSAYYKVIGNSLNRMFGAVEKIGVKVFINKEGGLVFKNTDPKLEQAAQLLLVHFLESSRPLDIQEAKKAIESEESANRDPLTGLWNRLGLEVAFQREIKKAVETKNYKGTGVLFFDIDNFKSFNDCFGQLVGDDLIKEIARRVRDEVRFTDVVCRFGGDEFVAVISNISRKEMEGVAEKIHTSTRFSYTADSGEKKDVSTSMGVAYLAVNDFSGEKGGTLLERAIEEANIADKYVKRTGKDGHCFYDQLPARKGEILVFDDFSADWRRRERIEEKIASRLAEIENAADDAVKAALQESLRNYKLAVEGMIKSDYFDYLYRALQEVKLEIADKGKNQERRTRLELIEGRLFKKK